MVWENEKMEQGPGKQRKVEEFVELIPEEERENTLHKDHPPAVWPAAEHISGRAGAPPLSSASAQRVAAYLSSPAQGGDGTPAAAGHDAGKLGRPRDSARRSPFLLAAREQLEAESLSPGKIPGQLVSPTKRGGGGGGGQLLEERGPGDGGYAHGMGGMIEVGPVEEGDVLIQVNGDADSAR